jgi:2-keto-4-pentenoate hydratase/2-oxohepta-3-ene-1,7-dioic acid hydratase in catechol pathway
MKLATFKAGGTTAPGLVFGEHIIALSRLLPRAPADMLGVIEHWQDLAPLLPLAAPQSGLLPLTAVELLAPIARPGTTLAIGMNYADHVREFGRELPAHQVWFGKLPGTINGPFAGVQIPRAAERVDYEVELVAVIGRAGRHISRQDAPAHVFGYCVGNDVSVRDWQRQTPQWLLGKSFDTHAPIGPWITTADEIGDPHRLGIRCLVNGEVRQSSNTRELIFNVWDQIAHVSKALTLHPGNLIFTGTPSGVGDAMVPPRLLKVGDRVRCEIDELGAIENEMVAES